MDNIALLQGQFTGNGTAINLAIPSTATQMWVWNQTEAAAANASHGVSYYWQQGLNANDGFVTLRNAGATAVNISTSATLAVGGFTLINQGPSASFPSTTLVGPSVAFTAISNATQPVISTGSTAGLSVGSVVRLSQVNTLPPDDQPVLGIDYQISAITPNVSFTLQGPLVNAPGGAGTAGFWRQVNISSIFYPQTRYIINITQAVNAVVTTSVDHGYVAGQQVRINVLSQAMNGMFQINGQIATITAVTHNTFTTNINSSGYNAFKLPTVAAGATPWVPYTPAFVDPVGANTAFALANNLNTLADATLNTSIVGIQLAAGITSPGGSNLDNIFWSVVKSYYNQIGF